MTHICIRIRIRICVGNVTIIGSDNGLSPGRCQAIIWNNAGILFIGPLGTNVSETLIEIHTFSFTKMRLKVSSAKWGPFCLGLKVLCDYKLIPTAPKLPTPVLQAKLDHPTRGGRRQHDSLRSLTATSFSGRKLTITKWHHSLNVIWKQYLTNYFPPNQLRSLLTGTIMLTP